MQMDIEFTDGRVGARAEVVQTTVAPRAEPPRRRRRRDDDPGQGNLFS
jgi:hypothetical protein